MILENSSDINMVGGGSEVLLIFISCCCFIIILAAGGGGLFFMFNKKKKAEIKKNIIVDENKKTGLDIVCNEGEKNVDNICKEIKTKEKCIDENNEFWIVDNDDNTKCVELESDILKTELVCRLKNNFYNYNPISKDCSLVVKEFSNESATSCKSCVKCSLQYDTTNQFYKQVKNEQTNYTSCRNRDSDEKKKYCIDLDRFYVSDNTCLINLRKKKPRIKLKTFYGSPPNNKFKFEFEIDHKNEKLIEGKKFISYEIKQVDPEPENDYTISNTLREDAQCSNNDQLCSKINIIKSTDNLTTFVFIPKQSAKTDKERTTFTIKAKLRTIKTGSWKNSNHVIEDNVTYETEWSHPLEFKTPCKQKTENECRNVCTNQSGEKTLCGPVTNYDIDVLDHLKDPTVDEWPYYKKF